MTAAVECLPGAAAPDFEAMAVGGPYGPEGALVRLWDFRGRPVVLYFYPKDDTPGCTAQACGLRDQWPEMPRDVALFGVSVDSPERHRKFIEKHALPFPLLSDEGRRIVSAYGVWVEKSLYGKKFMGTERTTFVIRPDGRIQSVFRKVKPIAHTGILLEDLANPEP